MFESPFILKKNHFCISLFVAAVAVVVAVVAAIVAVATAVVAVVVAVVVVVAVIVFFDLCNMTIVAFILLHGFLGFCAHFERPHGSPPLTPPPVTHDPQSVLLCPKSPFIPLKTFPMEVIDDIGTKKEKSFFFSFLAVLQGGGVRAL